eukprot:6375397-Pyramimonas_sp.AAC.1
MLRAARPNWLRMAAIDVAPRPAGKEPWRTAGKARGWARVEATGNPLANGTCRDSSLRMFVVDVLWACAQSFFSEP